MKKTIALFMLMTISLVAMAQEHLTFQGIPIDGSIASFEQKLKAKGWVYDYNLSKQVNSDTKIYNGTFGGIKGNLFVLRSPKSKVVFMLSFCGEVTYTKSVAESQKERHISSVRSKYLSADEGINDRGNTQFDLDNGIIICGITNLGLGAYASSITYIDLTNQQKSLSEEADDY